MKGVSRSAAMRASGLSAVVVVCAASSGQIDLLNRTDEALLTAVHSPQQVETMPWVTGGMAAGDFDDDGLADLYVVSGGAGPDHLYLNNGDGTFSDEALAWGLTTAHCGNGVAVGDYNGDGRLDLYLTSQGEPGTPDAPGMNRLLRNDGGSFTEVAASAGVNVASATSSFSFGSAFGDYDLDGDLDLFVATWQDGTDGNRLFRNDGDGTFTDVTADAIGLATIADMHGFQPAFADMDGDLYPELLIAADFGTSRYLVNDRDGTFTDATPSAGTGYDDAGMGQTIADFDNDGRLDWYVTSIFLDSPPAGYYRGNTLYHALGGHTYLEVATETGCSDGGWGWGTIALDLDQDGWIDIVEVNGRETAPPGEWTAEQAYLYHNDGNGSFTERGVESGLDHAASGRAVVWLDAENDGDLDVVIFTNAGPLNFYENTTDPSGHWLQIDLDTTGNPLLAPNGFGTRIDAVTGSHVQARVLNGSPSFLGTSQLRVHFGLGDAATVDELRITWSRGYVTTLHDVAAGQRITVTAPALADLDADGVVGVGDLIKLFLSWGEIDDPAESLVADVDNDGTVGVTDLIVIIGSWGS